MAKSCITTVAWTSSFIALLVICLPTFLEAATFQREETARLDPQLDNLTFTGSVLFNITRGIRSVVDCARTCRKVSACLTFTVSKVAGRCQGHSTVVTLSSPHVTSIYQCRTYGLPDTRPLPHTTTAPLLPWPCYNHMLLDDATRAVTNNAGPHLCDSLLSLQWYRFQINGVDATVPNACEGPAWNLICGTAAPIWLDLLGATLPVLGQQTEGRACASYNSVCCNWSSDGRFTPAAVNCSSFLVYRLQGLPECSLRWCAQL